MRRHLPVWPEGREGGKLDQEGMYYAGMIADQLQTPPQDWLVMSRRYTTQSVDTSALEPDNANGWFDTASQTLHLVIPTQSPQEVADEMPRMLAKRHQPVKQLILHPCYTVGYGSKITITSRITVRLPRCTVTGYRCGWLMTAMSNSRPRSNAMPSIWITALR